MLEEEVVDVAGRGTRECLGLKLAALEEEESATGVGADTPVAERGCMQLQLLQARFDVALILLKVLRDSDRCSYQGMPTATANICEDGRAR